MNTETTRKRLQVQGFHFDDATLAELGPWMRWSPAICTAVMLTGMALASPWVLWGLAIAAFGGVFLPNHPFDYIYNYGVRYVTGTQPLPPNTPARRFACGLATAWLVATGTAFYVGATTVAYALGVSLISVAALVSVTHYCIPSVIFNALFETKQPQQA